MLLHSIYKGSAIAEPFHFHIEFDYFTSLWLMCASTTFTM